MENEIEKAIDYFESSKHLFPNSYNVLSGNYDLAISALQKQIPKEIIINSDGYYPQCPNCLKDIGKYGKPKICPNCGQVLSWVHTNA